MDVLSPNVFKKSKKTSYTMSNPFIMKNILTPAFVVPSQMPECIKMTYEPELVTAEIKSNRNHSELDVKLQLVQEQKEDLCIDCNIKMKIVDGAVICDGCGLKREVNDDYCADNYNMSVDANYNSGTTTSVPFTFSGRKSYKYKKTILKCCSDASTSSFQLIKKDILNRINIYNGNKPPMNVQLLCVELYYKIKESDKSYLDIINRDASVETKKKRLVFRGNGKWGIIASCLYYACIKEGLSRTPREISDIIGVDENYQTKGNKRLHEFYELGIIDIPIDAKIINDYISRFFPLLEIPDVYKQFIVDLIDRIDQKYLNINNEKRVSIKCVAAIYILCTRVPELSHITKEIICRECKLLSFAAILKHCHALYSNFKALKKVFKKHAIPMPVEWKNK